MKFINEDFMLKNKTGKKLFYDYAKDMPIIDYHCHLSPDYINKDHKFKDITELMLGGDHYKWRAMRSNGIDEKYITGDSSSFEKFLKFAETLPMAIGNPLLHWTQLELKRYFDVDEILCPDTAKEIFLKCNNYLSRDDYGARGLITMSNVEVVCTTDDPKDDLKVHEEIKKSDFKTRVIPAFRPDKLVEIKSENFLPYLEEINISDFDDLINYITKRIEYFDKHGSKLSDHALNDVPFKIGDPKKVFDKAIRKEEITKEEEEIYKTAVLSHCAKEYKKRDWAMQLHIGALRNNNKKMYDILGPDTGYDSINDREIAEPLAKYLDYLNVNDILPKTILYTLNPKDNYVLGTMLGNFQEGPYKAKIQFGSGWWFNDQKDGMIAQMKSLANLGLLGRFIGMLTDSRSFISYTRHEYFRRVMCSLIGQFVEEGEYPEDYGFLKQIVENICYYNAKNYFNFK